MSPEDRFHESYATVTESGCWLWLGALSVKTYGLFHVGDRNWKAHRYSWQLHFGEIPAGLFVCHKCDVRRCVNPAHLFLATHLENMADMTEKGRKCGNGGRGISAAVVREIRAISGMYQKDIAKMYGVSQQVVSSIRTGKRKALADRNG